MFLQPELPSGELPALVTPSRHKHKYTIPTPSPRALRTPFSRGKRGVLAENNLLENGHQEPFTISPDVLLSFCMSLVRHVGTSCPLHSARRQELLLKQEVINAENRVKWMFPMEGDGESPNTGTA